MKKFLMILAMLWGVAYGQSTGYFRYDTIRMQRGGGNCELYIENGTRGVTGGVLTNMGGGRTAFVTPAGAVTASNGLTKVSSDIRWGGNLSAHTDIYGGNNYNITFDSTIFRVLGVQGTGQTVSSYAGAQMFFYPRKSAFRAGTAPINEWDDANIGTVSTAFGNNNTASGPSSMAWGGANTSSGTRTTAFGSGTTASGLRATAWGNTTLASGSMSTAWGNSSQATGGMSTAWGSGTLASGTFYSTAWGSNSQATALIATAWGDNTLATGINATTWGSHTRATDESTTAWGNFSQATGEYSTAWGDSSFASGETSSAWGLHIKEKHFAGTAIGTYNDSTNATSATSYNALNRAFQIGVGTADNARANAMTVLFSGKTTLNKYGVGTFTGTPAYNLQVDASGNIIEGALAGSGANTALSNLASVAINTSLLPGTTNSIDLGSTAKKWKDVIAQGDGYFGSGTPSGWAMEIDHGDIYLSGSGNRKIKMTSTGGWGLNIGTSTNDSYWTDAANTDYLRMYYNGGNEYTSVSSTLNVFNGGNTGVGTALPTSKLHVAGSFALPYRKVTADADVITGDDYTLSVDNGGSNWGITLPDATTCSGRIYVIKRFDETSVGKITISSAGGNVQSQNDGIFSSTYDILDSGEGLWGGKFSMAKFQSNGTDWEAIK